ncbi:MAG: succinyl-diaminopimelate desuccinylase [Pseudomonadota bacterium]
MTDPAIAYTQSLIRCRSVTPADDGALAMVERVLEPLGFRLTRMAFGKGDERVENLYARRGDRDQGPVFCFAGHTDVVPPGDEAAWTHDAFAATIDDDGVLYGRGAVDMKGNIGGFLAALERAVADGTADQGSISLIITGDEEGLGVNGTCKVLEWMQDQGEGFDLCLVGEPTSIETLGDVMKIGRRGSLTGTLTVQGVQGHVAYPHRADNPLHPLVRLLNTLIEEPLDQGTEHFEPSTLQLTTIDVGNPTSNVIPGQGMAVFNSRFNNRHTPETLTAEIRRRLDTVGVAYDLDIRVSAKPFLTAPGPLIQAAREAIEQVTGITPAMTTGGGTSDARFVADYGPVFEFGLVGDTMHQVDERVPSADLPKIADAYHAILQQFFATAGGNP